MVDKLVEEILAELRQQNTSSDAIWDARDIAYYMRLSKSTVQSRVICRPNFPRALRMPTSNIGQGGRRWLAKEVKQWVMRCREPLSN